MDINIGETPAGRLKMELFSDIVPKLAVSYCDWCDTTEGYTGHQRTSGNCALENTGNILARLPGGSLILKPYQE